MTRLECSRHHQFFIGGRRCEPVSGGCSDVDAAVTVASRALVVGERASAGRAAGRRSVNILRQNASGCHMERFCQTRL